MKKITFLLITVLILISFSCHRKKYLEQDVNGSVKLFDQTLKITDLKGMKVLLSNYEDTAETDENGLYYLKDVPVGTYKVTFIKNGYPQLSINNFQIIGNGQEPRHIPHVNIIQYPTIEVKNFRDTAINSFYTDIKADIEKKDLKADDEVALIAYISHSSDVSINKYERKKLLITKDNYILLNGSFGIKDGEYVVFYACPYFDNLCYENNDSIYFWNDFLMTTDENGNIRNPYYKKISQVYKYEKK